MSRTYMYIAVVASLLLHATIPQQCFELKDELISQLNQMASGFFVERNNIERTQNTADFIAYVNQYAAEHLVYDETFLTEANTISTQTIWNSRADFLAAYPNDILNAPTIRTVSIPYFDLLCVPDDTFPIGISFAMTEIVNRDTFERAHGMNYYKVFWNHTVENRPIITQIIEESVYDNVVCSKCQSLSNLINCFLITLQIVIVILLQ
eukprot:74460_1